MSYRVFPLLALLAGCASGGDPRQAHVDHVIIGVSDLDRGINELERLTGVRAVDGGAHPGQGTRNALMSLSGGAYLELYAPNPAELSESKEVDALRRLTTLKPLGWAISSDDAPRLRSLLEQNGFPLTRPEAGSRRRPDGSILRWQTFGFAGLGEAEAPFFILWDDPSLHPSRTSPFGCRLKRIDIQTPAKRLAQAIAPLRLPVKVSPAPVPTIAVTLACPTGQLVLR